MVLTAVVLLATALFGVRLFAIVLFESVLFETVLFEIEGLVGGVLSFQPFRPHRAHPQPAPLSDGAWHHLLVADRLGRPPPKDSEGAAGTKEACGGGV